MVVAGVDFSNLSDCALDEALVAASARSGELYVVYVAHDILHYPVVDLAIDEAAARDAALEQVRQRAVERRDAVAAKAGPLGVTRIVVHFRRGSPAEEIAQLAADLDADLVVVGSHGRRGLARVLLGSVAERTSRLARCPVWIVRPKDHDASGREGLAFLLEYRHDAAGAPLFFRGGAEGGAALGRPNARSPDTLTLGATAWF